MKIQGSAMLATTALIGAALASGATAQKQAFANEEQPQDAGMVQVLLEDRDRAVDKPIRPVPRRSYVFDDRSNTVQFGGSVEPIRGDQKQVSLVGGEPNTVGILAFSARKGVDPNNAGGSNQTFYFFLVGRFDWAGYFDGEYPSHLGRQAYVQGMSLVGGDLRPVTEVYEIQLVRDGGRNELLLQRPNPLMLMTSPFVDRVRDIVTQPPRPIAPLEITLRKGQGTSGGSGGSGAAGSGSGGAQAALVDGGRLNEMGTVILLQSSQPHQAYVGDEELFDAGAIKLQSTQPHQGYVEGEELNGAGTIKLQSTQPHQGWVGEEELFEAGTIKLQATQPHQGWAGEQQLNELQPSFSTRVQNLSSGQVGGSSVIGLQATKPHQGWAGEQELFGAGTIKLQATQPHQGYVGEQELNDAGTIKLQSTPPRQGWAGAEQLNNLMGQPVQAANKQVKGNLSDDMVFIDDSRPGGKQTSYLGEQQPKEVSF